MKYFRRVHRTEPVVDNTGYGRGIHDCIDDAIETALDYLSGHYMSSIMNLISTNVYTINIDNNNYLYVTTIAEYPHEKGK